MHSFRHDTPQTKNGEKKQQISALEKKIIEGEKVVRDLIFSHIRPRDGHKDVLNKAVYLGLVVRRLIKAKYDEDYIDDKDYYGNKRLELSGHLMSFLFEDKFKGLNSYLQRARKGGLRVGEMERDCLIGHGSALLLYERLMVSSDKYKCQICRKCQLIVSFPDYCNYCNSSQYISETEMPYACKLLFQELMSMNISPRIQLTDQFT